MKTFIHILAVSLLLALALACGSSGELANTGGISGTSDGPQLAKTLHITDFNLAHPSYGEKRAKGLYLYSLSPVISIRFEEEAPSDLASYLSLKLIEISSNREIEITPDQQQDHFRFDTESNVLYITVYKSGQLELDSFDLKPGEEYQFELTAAEPIQLVYQGAQILKYTGSLSTSTLTLTYPISNSQQDSMVRSKTRQALHGVSTNTPIFYIHCRKPVLNYNPQDATGFGLADDFSLSVNGTSLNDTNLSHLNFLESSAQAFSIQVKPGLLASGEQYGFVFSPKTTFIIQDGESTRNLQAGEYPSAFSVHMGSDL